MPPPGRPPPPPGPLPELLACWSFFCGSSLSSRLSFQTPARSLIRGTFAAGAAGAAEGPSWVGAPGSGPGGACAFSCPGPPSASKTIPATQLQRRQLIVLITQLPYSVFPKPGWIVPRLLNSPDGLRNSNAG